MAQSPLLQVAVLKKTSANGILSQHCKHAVLLSLSKYGCHQVAPQGRNMQQSVSWNSSTYRSSLFYHSRKGTLDTAGSVNPQLHFFFLEQSTTPLWQCKSTMTVAIYAAALNKETKKISPKQKTGVLAHYMNLLHRQTSFPLISQLCRCHYSYGSKCHFYKIKVLSCLSIMLALKWTVLLLGIHWLITGSWPFSGFHLRGFLQMAKKQTACSIVPLAFKGRVIQ